MGEMKLFLVIYMMGKIGGTVGPLPNGLDACMGEALSLNQQAQAVMKSGITIKGDVLTPLEKERIASMSFSCEYHAIRPKNDYP